jgi:hypothetical protein
MTFLLSHPPSPLESQRRVVSIVIKFSMGLMILNSGMVSIGMADFSET